jgi:hypothetical protein
MLPPQRPSVARACCVAEARTMSEEIARFLDGLPSLVSFFAFAKYTFPKLQADISERVNLLRFAKLAPTFFNRARAESRRFASRLGHRALAFLALDPPTSSPPGASSVTSSLSTTTPLTAAACSDDRGGRSATRLCAR